MGMRSTVDERCQHRQAAQTAWGGPSCMASSTQRHKCCSLRVVPERSDLQHLLSTPTLQRGERSTSQARPHPGPTTDGSCSPQRITPPKMHRHSFLERWLSNIPLLSSNTTTTSPSCLGALTCHAASLGQGGLLPTCREENRRVTDSLDFQPSFKAQTSITQDQIHAESMVLSGRPTTDPSQAVPLREPKIPAASPLFTSLEGLRAPSAPRVLEQVPGRSTALADQ